ncbi:hypothetical protein BGZ99_002747 [Dissophora globulifera]|uniref:Uncharacterized protein n=1 Tax=Dissophora globulifera TaxID=979702 RepID=A0A9P6RN74_9FUNG|nr:hypothetical protein BGZ99_002747 [Dissophora globulifera]
MKYKVEFTFTGPKKCKVLFCTSADFICGCDTCKSWLDHETTSFSDQKDWTFGHIPFENSPQTKTFDICSHHVMTMNLVPFKDNAYRKAKDLDLMVFGSDLGGTWTDTVMVDGQKCSVNIRVFDPANPKKVTKTANKLEFRYTGSKKCKMVYTTLFDCGCETCKGFKKSSTATFADSPETKYGAIWFESSPHTTTFNLCSHHVIAMNLVPFDDVTVRNAADLDVLVSGSDLGGVWEDEVKVVGVMNKVTVKVYAADTSVESSQIYSLMPKRTRKLEFTFSGPKKSMMVFTVTNGCGCSTCRWWSQNTTKSFVDNPDKKYGVITFESSPFTIAFDICSRHKMQMNLVPFNTKAIKTKDLDVLISGAELNAVFTDTVKIEGKLNRVKVKVLKAPKAASTNSVASWSLNQLQLNFTGVKRSRLLYSVDPELDCDCDNCKWWIAQATNAFKDEPNRAYGYFNFEISPYTMTYEICPNNVVLMSLVDFENIERNAADLDIQVFGSEVGCGWTDKVTIEGFESVLRIDIKAPPLPPRVAYVTVTAAAPMAPKKAVPAGGGKFKNKNENNKNNKNSNKNNNSNALLALQMQNMTLTQTQMVQNVSIQQMQSVSIQQEQESVNTMYVNVNNYAAANAEAVAYTEEVQKQAYNEVYVEAEVEVDEESDEDVDEGSDEEVDEGSDEEVDEGSDEGVDEEVDEESGEEVEEEVEEEVDEEVDEEAEKEVDEDFEEEVEEEVDEEVEEEVEEEVDEEVDEEAEEEEDEEVEEEVEENEYAEDDSNDYQEASEDDGGDDNGESYSGEDDDEY